MSRCEVSFKSYILHMGPNFILDSESLYRNINLLLDFFLNRARWAWDRL